MICSGTFPVSGFLFNFNGRAENEKEENGISDGCQCNVHDGRMRKYSKRWNRGIGVGRL